MAKTFKRALIAVEDLNVGTGTASRSTSTGGSQTVTKIPLTMDSSGNLTIPALFKAKRVAASQGTALVAGDFVLSAGWGASASITIGSGTDQAFNISITANGTTGANPTLALTFHDGTWTTTPIFVACRSDGGSAPTTAYWQVTTIAGDRVGFTFIGTPTSGNSYGICAVGMGI